MKRLLCAFKLQLENLKLNKLTFYFSKQNMAATNQDLLALQNRADLLESMIESLKSQLEQITGKKPDEMQTTTSSVEESKENELGKGKGKQKRTARAIDALGARMKQYEEQAYNTKFVDNNLPLIVRLDGHCFHTFTKGFIRPFDKNLHRAMVLTTGDLVDRFQAYCGYTQSDEITLIFPAANDNEEKVEEKIKIMIMRIRKRKRKEKKK